MSKPIKISDDYLNAFKFGFKFFILLSALSIPPIIGTTVGVLIHQIFEKIPALYVSELKVLEMRTSPFSKEDLTQYSGSVEQIIEFKKIRSPRDLLQESKIDFIPSNDLSILDKPATKTKFDISTARPLRLSDIMPNLYVLLNRKVKDKSEKNELESDISDILTDSETRTITYLDNPSEKLYSIPNWRKTIIYGDFTPAGGWIFGVIVFFIVIICLALFFPIFKAFANLFKHGKIIK